MNDEERVHIGKRRPKHLLEASVKPKQVPPRFYHPIRVTKRTMLKQATKSWRRLQPLQRDYKSPYRDQVWWGTRGYRWKTVLLTSDHLLSFTSKWQISGRRIKFCRRTWFLVQLVVPHILPCALKYTNSRIFLWNLLTLKMLRHNRRQKEGTMAGNSL